MLINDFPMKQFGMHMIIQDNGDLERIIVEEDKEIELPPVNLKDVIIDLSETRHVGYIILLRALEEKLKKYKGQFY